MGDEEARPKRAFVLFGLGFAIASFAAACYPNPNDLRAGSGSAGQSGTGGRTTGTGGQPATGGVTGSGGRVGTGGMPAGAGGFVGPGTALVPNADGWIDGRTNAFGIQGSWYAFSDGRGGPDGTASMSTCIAAGHPASACAMITSPPTNRFPNTGGKMCFVGSVARVINNPMTGMPDYSNIWGATMAFDLNYQAGAHNPKAPFNFSGKGLKGISFDLDVIPTYGLRVGFTNAGSGNVGPAYWGANANYDPSPVKVGTNLVYLTAVSHPMAIAFDTTMIYSIEFNVPTSTVAGAPFNFCVSNVNVLLQ